jgi:hypothetical protein
MLRILQTFNSHNINDGSNYRSTIENPNALPAAQPVFIAHARSDSEDAGTYTVEAQTLALSITVVNYANRVALIAQLKQWLKRGTLGDLVATYRDEGVNYYKPCRVVNLVADPDYPLHFTAMLQTGWSTWKAVTADTYTWNLTGTGGDHTVDLDGDDETPLSVTFELSAGPATGYLYQRLYQLISQPAPVPALGYGPWCIELDTAALIADDSHKCQINVGGGINASAVTIPYDTVTGTVPNAGTGYVDTEQIRWTGKTGTTSGDLTGVTRGVGGTTAASHADNAVIRVSRMQANGADLRVFIDGAEVNRWIASINTTTTKIWFNLTMNQGYSLVLRTALDDSTDYDYIYFAITADSKATVAMMPQDGIIVHGTEWIKYQKAATGPQRLAVVERGLLGSTKQAHAAGDIFQFMEHAITVCYGNADAVAPATQDATYDNTKPVFLLTSSDNDTWVYDATTLWYDIEGTGRTGGWTPSIGQRLGDVSRYYAIKEDALGGEPAMGMAIGSFQRGTGWTSEYARILWDFYRSCGVDNTTFTGQKYRTDDAWPSSTALRKSSDGALYTPVWAEATPASPDAWTALAAHNDVAHSGAAWMRFGFGVAYAAGQDSQAFFEILTGTVDFVSANLPTGTLLSQATNGTLDLILSNAANGDELEVITPMLIGLPLVVDGEAKTVLYNNTNAHDAITPDDESRDTWLRLQPGNNALTIAATDVGTLEAVLTWHKRRF